MICLRNVKIENNKIFADYYPEDSNEFSIATINLDNVNECYVPPVGYDLECKGHIHHARIALMEMVEGERDIADCQIMWY